MAKTQTSEVIYRQIIKAKSSALTNRTNEVILKKVNIHILEMEDVLFHLNSCVLMPENPKGKSSADGGGVSPDDESLDITGVQALAIVFKQFEFDPDVKMIVTGHTDTSGSPDFNFKLSDERAQNVLCLLTGLRKEWMDLCYGRHKIEDCQQIMKYFSTKRGWDCDPVDIDDKWGDNTDKATKKFFVQLNPVDASANYAKVKNDGQKRWPKTVWGYVYDEYTVEMASALEIKPFEMKSRRNTVSFIDDKKRFLGCGESFPIQDKEKTNYRSQKNRRVELLFFDKDEIPEINCPAVKSRIHTEEECPLWHKFYFHNLYIDPADLKAVVFHLKFMFYDKLKQTLLPVPEGLVIKAFGDNKKEIPSETIFKNDIYYVKVKFGTKIKDPSRKEFYFEFETKDKWILSKDGKTEIISKSADEYDKLTLKEKFEHYDLPVRWSSKKYWTRYDGFFKGDIFEKVIKDECKLKPFGDETTKADKPLIFCLDDIVLTDNDLKPITQTAGNYEAAIFNENFSVVNPDSGNHKSYYSEGGIKTTAEFLYVRVPFSDSSLGGVILKHLTPPNSLYKLFAVFKDRVPGTHELCGHRAAVYEHKTNCVLVKRFQQRHQRSYHNIGRYDSYLLRNINVKNDEEISFIFNYFRWFLRGKNPPVINQEWINNAIVNLKYEWNRGADGSPPSLYFEKDKKKTRIFIRYHIEQVPDADKETLVNVNPAGGSGRSNMGRDEGNIKVDEHERNAAGTFTAAHEFGHATSLDDDYIETVNFASVFRPGFVDFKPGGPFNLDNNSMMKGNKEIRPRHYWHFANWMRKEFITGQLPDFSVKMKNKNDYALPYNAADQFDPRDMNKDAASYVNVPYKILRNAANQKSTRDYKGKFHLYLYPLGKDDYSMGGLYGTGNFTALLVVIVNLYFDDWAGNPNTWTIYDNLQKFETAIHNNFRTSNGIKIKGDKPFEETFVQIIPRFCSRFYPADYTGTFPGVTNAQYTAGHDQALASTEGTRHFITNIVTGSSSIDLSDPPELDLQNNAAELANFWKYFSHALGLGYGETLNKDNFGVGDFVPNGVVQNI